MSSWIPPRDVPLDSNSAFTVLLPPLLTYFCTAFLTLIPKTRLLKLAILPVHLVLAFRAGMRLDMSGGDPGQGHINQSIVLLMLISSSRTAVFAARAKPYHRKRVSSTKTSGLTRILFDATDLCCNFRGVNWEWSKGCFIPPSSGKKPSLWKSLSLLVLFDFVHYHVASLSSRNGGSIFLEEYPPVQRYLMSTYITFLTGLVIYQSVDIPYALLASCCIPFLGQKAEEWPPISNKPWKATSLDDFWGRRWHQLMRFPLVEVGYKPLAWITGGNRAAGVMGAFTASGLLHYAGAWGQSTDTEFWKIGGFFMLMGVGILLERGWQAVTGRKVQGVSGAVWTFVWLLSCGQLAADAWGRSGMMASDFVLPDWLRPSYRVFGPLK